MALLRPFRSNMLVPHIMGNSGCSWYVMIQVGRELYPTFTWETRALEGLATIALTITQWQGIRSDEGQ
jgi:hypothetical protein